MSSQAPLRPLSGIRVLDFTSTVAGPWCTRLLADAGAEVIKVETAGEGDFLRMVPPIAGGISRVYAHFNCGKRSVALDLKSVAGLALARRLALGVDIVVENFRPGVMAKFGLDYASLSVERPDLIYASVSGFGQTGVRAGQAAYAPVVHALSGFDNIVMRAGGGAAPPVSGVMIADVVAGAYAFGAVQTALLHRMRHGKGTQIDAALLESMMSLVAIPYQEAQATPPLESRRFSPIQVLDGWVMIPLVSLKSYQSLFIAIDRPDWAAQFGSMRAIMQGGQPIDAAVAAWAGTRTSAEVEMAMTAAGVPCAPYRSPGEMLQDQALQARGAFTPVSDAGGDFVVLNTPFTLSDGSCSVVPTVSALGEDTEAVLASVLGLGPDDLASARRDGAFG